MTTAVSTILRSATRENLNIIKFAGYARFDITMARVFSDHNFYIVTNPQLPLWKEYTDLIPDNLHIIENKKDNIINMPIYLDFDAIIIENRNLQMQTGLAIAQQLQLPIIHLQTNNNKKYAHGDFNVSWTEKNRFNDSFQVISPFVDEFLFQNIPEKENKILCVIDDQKDDNFTFANAACHKLPHTIADTNSHSELIELYKTHSIFLNANVDNPLPYSCIEALNAGCILVSPINELQTGFFYSEASPLRKKLEELCKIQPTKTELYTTIKLNQSAIDAWKQVFNKLKDFYYTDKLHRKIP